ncbi:hypothetical protein [Altererythrobacter aquiaggeris]|uniref:hypothetical protein n=1 Tax=Aestuarierythrobacter aquiaggeris TaxID=1898396 RepID=UPI003019D797
MTRTPARSGRSIIPAPQTRRWSDAMQAEFLRQLSATHSVSAAAHSVGMSRQSAYRLRSRLKGQAFDLGWDMAFHHSFDNLAHAALGRALNGVEMPVFFKGEQVGSYRKFDERLTVALMALGRRGPIQSGGRLAMPAEAQSQSFDDLVAAVERGAAPQLDYDGYLPEYGGDCD